MLVDSNVRKVKTKKKKKNVGPNNWILWVGSLDLVAGLGLTFNGSIGPKLNIMFLGCPFLQN